MRSQTHPVPSLRNNTDWIEAPFWVWTEGETQRHRVFARQSKKTLHLSDGEKEFCVLPINPDMDACCAVEALRELAASGIRFRTRALTTTLYSRLLLADIFVHGIGGAKYDEMTDRIIHRLYGIVPPAFQVISATVRLPFTDQIEIASNQRTELTRQLRDLRYNPQSVPGVGDLAAIETLMREKQQLVAAEQSKHEGTFNHAANYERYLRLRQISVDIQRHTASQQADITRQLDELRHAAAMNALIQSREFSFGLFPESKLRPFLTT